MECRGTRVLAMALVTFAALAAAATARAGPGAEAAAGDPTAVVSLLAPAGFGGAAAEPMLLEAPDGGRAGRAAKAGATPASLTTLRAHEVLGGARARILLRSLTVPGWGQATLGRKKSATFFGLTETAIWGSFVAFRIQVAMREDSYLRTARLMAGIDLSGRDEEWRRIVGGYSSSEEYNLLVVTRDAANLYYDDPEAYRAYVAAHSLGGADAWRWASTDAQARYSSQRKKAQRAAQRANTVLAVAVVNRIMSALHAARVAGQPAPAKHAWQLEAVPGVGEDPLAFQLRVRTQF